MVDNNRNNNMELKENGLWSLFLSKGGTVSQLRSISENQLESIYQQGFSHFETGHFKEALTIFRYLAIMNHRDTRYFLAMGLSLSQLDLDSAAIPPLDYASRIDNSDPRPSLAMVECFIKLKNRGLAESALKEAARILKSESGWKEERSVALQFKKYLTGETFGEKQ